MGVRTPFYSAGAAQSIDNAAAEVYGAAFDLRGFGKATVYVYDVGSGGALTVKFFGEPDPAAAAPTVVANLAQLGPDITHVDGADTAYEVPGSVAWLLVEMQHATGDTSVTMDVVATPETGAGEW